MQANTLGGMEPSDGRARQASEVRSNAKNASLQARHRGVPHTAYDYLIVGAGFAGSVLSERLARVSNKRVLIVDKRSHVGGNAFDEYNAAGILVHRYGPHIFHTNSQRIVAYLSQFTDWHAYRHRVLAYVDNQLLPIPINLTTLNRLYSLNLTSEEAELFLAERAETVVDIKTSEDVVVSKVGRELYEKFFRGYSKKQWGVDPSQLDRSVTSRVPVRTTLDDAYFNDVFQSMPLQGYTRMFERMLDHPNIEIKLNTNYRDAFEEVSFRKLIYSGPIDEFFDYRFGKLPYRSLQFQHRTLDQAEFQPVGVVNYPSEDIPYTRISEYKHMTGQLHDKTSVTYEFPSATGEPFYPIPCPANAALFDRYQELASTRDDVTFIGRLGSYRYYNMDQVVAQALSAFEHLRERDVGTLTDLI